MSYTTIHWRGPSYRDKGVCSHHDLGFSHITLDQQMCVAVYGRISTRNNEKSTSALCFTSGDGKCSSRFQHHVEGEHTFHAIAVSCCRF